MENHVTYLYDMVWYCLKHCRWADCSYIIVLLPIKYQYHTMAPIKMPVGLLWVRKREGIYILFFILINEKVLLMRTYDIYLLSEIREKISILFCWKQALSGTMPRLKSNIFAVLSHFGAKVPFRWPTYGSRDDCLKSKPYHCLTVGKYGKLNLLYGCTTPPLVNINVYTNFSQNISYALQPTGISMFSHFLASALPALARSCLLIQTQNFQNIP